MKFRNIFIATLISAAMTGASGVAYAKGPDQQQQQHQVQQHQQAPGKPGMKKAPPKKSSVKYIRVHWGDTLSGIAHRYHTTVWRLKRLNHLRSDRIYAGQRLRVR